MKSTFTRASEKIRISGKLSPDSVKLFIDIEKLKDEQVSALELYELIKDEIKVPEMIDRAVLEDIATCLNRGEEIKERRITKGRAAENGANGKLLLLVKKYTGQGEVKIDDRGFAHYAHLSLFENLVAGQLVGRVYPPKNGVDGVDGFGEPIASKPGNPYKSNLDPSIALKNSERPEDEFQVLVAEKEGMLVEESGGRLLIKDEFIVEGDLDYRYGNIDFIGKVKVRGDVHQGFVIKAKTGIEVAGCVNSATLICSQGGIVVKGLVVGGRGTRILCSGDFRAALTQEVDAEIQGDIIVDRVALDSNLRSYSALRIPQGELIGGRAFVVTGAEFKVVGTDAYAPTVIRLCSDVETTRDYQKIKAEIASHEKAENLMKLHLGPLVDNPARLQLLKEPHRGKMEALLKKLAEVQKSKTWLTGKAEKMLEKGHANDVLRVNFSKMLYPGVQIRARQETFAPMDEIKGPASIDYRPAERRFDVGELKPLEKALHDYIPEGGEEGG